VEGAPPMWKRLVIMPIMVCLMIAVASIRLYTPDENIFYGALCVSGLVLAAFMNVFN